jgi:hypothetical protein
MPEIHNIVASLPLIEPNAAGIDVGGNRDLRRSSCGPESRADSNLSKVYRRFGDTRGLARAMPDPNCTSQ